MGKKYLVSLNIACVGTVQPSLDFFRNKGERAPFDHSQRFNAHSRSQHVWICEASPATCEAKWQIKKTEINEEAHWEAHWEGLTESEEGSDAEFLIQIPVAQMEAKTDLRGWWVQQRYPWAQITPADSGER